MKKLFYAFVLAGAALFTACGGDLTPEFDSTKLWPAGEDNSNLAGYIDANGKMVIVANYSKAMNFCCGWAYVQDGRDGMFIGKNGKRAKVPSADEYSPYFYNNRLTFINDKLMGKMDNNFNIVVRANYSQLGPTADNGYCYFQKEGETLYGYMDKNGKEIISDVFMGAGTFSDGIAVVSVERNDETRYGVIDTRGEYVIDLGKKLMWNLGDGRIAVYNSSNEKCNMIDKNDNPIVDGYSAINPFTDGLAIVYKNEKGGYVNTKGDEVIDLRYEIVYPFTEGVAWVQKDNTSRWLLIDKKGETLFNLKEQEWPYGVFHNGLCVIYNDDKKEYRYINKYNDVIYKWSAKGYEPDNFFVSSYMELAPQRRHNTVSRFMLGTEYGPLFMDYMKVMSR